MNKRVMTC